MWARMKQVVAVADLDISRGIQVYGRSWTFCGSMNSMGWETDISSCSKGQCFGWQRTGTYRLRSNEPSIEMC